MSWTSNLIKISISLINSIILIENYLIEPNAKAVVLSSIALLILTIPILLSIYFSKLETASLNAIIISLVLIITETLFYFRIIESPAFETWGVAGNDKAIEMLNKQPYVKFKSNVKVRSQGNRGNDFIYTWLTDSKGYKNLINEENLSYDYIALGDSFTEGMGVSTEDTWVSKINKRSSKKIYNAGVQGYSASQMKATYENLSSQLTYDGVLICLLPKIYKRESKFSKENILISLENGKGGIEAIINPRERNSFLTEFLRALWNAYSLESKLKAKEDQRSPYIGEIPINYNTSTTLKENKNWKIYVKELMDIIISAKQRNKKIVIIQFPHRHEIYFNNKELGIENLSKIDYYVEINLLKNSLPDDVKILDIYPYLKSSWQSNNEYLYFIKDGHMNNHGHELVANFLLNNLP